MIKFNSILMLCTCQVRDAEEGKIWQFGLKYQVHIINGFKNHSKPLVVHCRSKQDDLGQHSLQVGQEFMWHFKVRFDGSTLFSCDVKQGKLVKHFDAFNASIEGSECAENGRCYWLVAEAGFYFSADDFTWEKKFRW
ncbi:hypothetical protein Pfo_026561 [Paulownia fortunei]|nr:hypothetical protein Pfo_026561 [Paulownia fortunei]